MESSLVEINDLKKSFDKKLVLKGINLSLDSGNVVAIMGPNGSGKTTLLKCVLGLVNPDSGEITVKGINIKNNCEYRKFIGYMPQKPRYPGNLKVKELIRMLKDVTSPSAYGATGQHSPPKGQAKERESYGYDEELVNKLILNNEQNIYDKPFGNLSEGTKQRVNSSLAFLFNREIIILDEPTAGLDPVSSELVKDKIKKERDKGKLVIITSHISSEVEKLAERIIYLLEGNIVLDRSIDELKKTTGEEDLNKTISDLIKNNSN